MNRPTQNKQHGTPIVIDPTAGASHIGYREIAGDLPSSEERITLKAWVLVFEFAPQANHHYQLLHDLLESVNGSGLAAVHLAGVQAERLGSMSARTDLLGEVADIWVTAMADGSDARGAVLVALNDIVVHLLTVSPYEAEGYERAVYVLAHIAANMDERVNDLKLPAWSDTMSRLPILGDVGDALLNTRVGINRYTARR